MSEDNKEAVEVGIPLDELSPQESTVEEEIEGSPPDNEDETSSALSGLPDLFEPEELAEVGLSSELIESGEIEEEGDRTDDESALPTLEPPIDDEKALNILKQDTADDDEEPSQSDSLRADPAEEAEEVEPIEPPPLPETDTMVALEHDDAGMDAQTDGGMDVEIVPPPIERDDIEPTEANQVESTPDTDSDDFFDQDLLVGRLESLSHQIDELQREFEGKLKYDAHKDEIIDRLHSELQEYKQDIIKKYVLSIVMDVVKVADDIRKWLTYFRSLEVSQRDPRKLFRYLEAIPSDLEDVFYWHGVKPFSNQEGTFDPARQRAIKKVPTEDPTLDKNVVHSIRPGYEWETKVIRQEMVAVYVYQEAQESTNTGMIDE